jgi:hypothetical protein
MVDFSLVSFLSKGLSILGNVCIQLFELILESISLWDQDIVKEVMGIEQFSLLILDLLFESGNFSVVNISSSCIFMMDGI